jgi:hypothetical protein
MKEVDISKIKSWYYLLKLRKYEYKEYKTTMVNILVLSKVIIII